jgi:hypothetical protein
VRIVKALHCRIGVLRGIDDVTVFYDRRDAGVQRFQHTDVISKIYVLGLVTARVDQTHPHEIVGQAPVGGHAAQLCLPHVTVRVDESRQHDATGRIDGLCIGSVDARGNLGDAIAVDQNVGRFLAE